MQAYATPAGGASPQLRLVSSAPSTVAPSAGAIASEVVHELLEDLAEIVAERVATRLAPTQRQHTDEWLDSRRAAEHLGISRDSLRRLAAGGSIPNEQAGAGCKIFFRRLDLDKWRCEGSGPVDHVRGRCNV